VARLVTKERLVGYEAPRRFYEIGSTAGLAETHAYLRAQESA
jgi:hypothetical protein